MARRHHLPLLVCLVATSAIFLPGAQAQTAPATTTYVAALYGAQETPPNTSGGSGVATLVLSADGTSAKVSVTTSGLAGNVTNTHIYGPAGPGATGGALFAVPPIPNLTWTFAPTGNLAVQDQLNALKSGNLYVNVDTDKYPNGEVRGQFYAVTTSPVNPPPYVGPRADVPTQADAVRFLEQSTFGPQPGDAAAVTQSGLRQFITNQFAAAPSNYDNIPVVDFSYTYRLKARFFANAATGPDQLRQRVAFALGQIMVVSGTTTAYNGSQTLYALQSYQGLLMKDALGNFRTLMYDVATNPAMGAYLNMVNNDKANTALNTSPNENFARELMQLFSIGVFQLNSDGTLQLDGGGQPIPTYGNAQIEAFAAAFTGWTYPRTDGKLTTGHNSQNFSGPMVAVAANHDDAAKTLLGGVTLPASLTPQAILQAPQTDMNAALDNIFSQPNVGPFIARRLIQHLVTSNPSPGYVARVAAVFNNNGQGVRGDLQAVVKAILLDGDAGLPAGRTAVTDPNFGHLREPALYVMNLIRGFKGAGDMWGVPELSSQLGQDVFSPATVFSFYQPDFQLSTVGGTTFYGPEAQTLTTNTSLARLNFVNTLIYGKINAPTYPNPPLGTSVTIDLSPYDSLAATPDTLVSTLDQFFTHGSLSTAAHNAIVTAVNAIPTTATNYARQRVQAAAYLIATSVQYQVEH